MFDKFHVSGPSSPGGVSNGLQVLSRAPDLAPLLFREVGELEPDTALNIASQYPEARSAPCPLQPGLPQARPAAVAGGGAGEY
jgi:hypothetical protein